MKPKTMHFLETTKGWAKMFSEMVSEHHPLKKIDILYFSEWKDHSQSGKIFFQIIYLIEITYPEYIKNISYSKIRKQTTKKMGKDFEQTLYQRRYMDGI